MKLGKWIATVAGLMAILVSGCKLLEKNARFDHEMQLLKKDNQLLQQRVAELETELASLRGIQSEYTLLKNRYDTQEEFYRQITAQVKDMIEEFETQGKVDGKLTLVSDVSFKPGSASLTPAGEKEIKQIAEKIKNNNLKIKIIGHTDHTPIKTTAKKYPTKTNLELGLKRALTVMTELLKNGVSEDKILGVESRGYHQPQVKSNDPKSLAQNRRVEIYLIKN